MLARMSLAQGSRKHFSDAGASRRRCRNPFPHPDLAAHSKLRTLRYIVDMPKLKWLDHILPRRERPGDTTMSTDDQSSQAAPPVTTSHQNYSAGDPASTLTTGHPSLESNSPPQPTRTRIKRLTIQNEDNLGIQILCEPPNGSAAIVDIVFVHGLTGNAYNTWLEEDSQVHWPSQLLREDLQDARILSFGYDANVVHWFSAASVNRIGNHAEALLGALVRRRERTDSEDRKIIFVMHSLGGLVVQNALALSRSSPEAHLQKVQANTVALAFLGTPHLGADLASWGRYGTLLLNVVKKTNKEIVQVLKPDSEMLATIQKGFHEILRSRQAVNQPIAVTCFHEELPLPVLGMVSS
jgi:pimeloyl-ACP methyl ester carboxylesterase